MTTTAPRVDMAALRAPFPYLNERVYLDTAAAGLCWQGQGAAVGHFYEAIKSRGYDAAAQWRGETARLRQRLADWLGCDADGLSFTANTSEGLNLVAHSIDWRAGDRIVLAADEFPSVAAAWEPARRAGATVTAVAIDDESRRDDRLIEAIAGGARLLAVSHVHWSTGTRVDLARLAAACQAQDTLLLVDGMQGLGATETRLAGVDFYAASCFKWLLSGFGIGLLSTSARGRAALTPAFRGYANLDSVSSLQYAHVNLPGVYGLAASLDFLEHVGWPLIHDRVQTLARHCIASAQRMGFDVVTPASACAGIQILRCAQAEALQAALATEGISVSARGDGIRISPHYYNTIDEIDHCLDRAANWLAAQ